MKGEGVGSREELVPYKQTTSIKNKLFWNGGILE
jgi:hypothetical protein